MTIRLFVAKLISIGFVLSCHAQPGSLDRSFYSGSTTDGKIYTTALQNDGSLVIGGDFTVADNGGRGRVARLKPDGSLDTSFGAGLAGANDIVWCVASQPDGKVLMAGQFGSVNGTARSWFARLNVDGSLDTNFVGSPAGFVNAIVLQPDGKILIGGSFLTVNGLSRGRLTRLNSNGSLDNTFTNAFGPYAEPGQVNAIALQTNGYLIVGGSFTNVGLAWRGRIARIKSDGFLDSSFAAGLVGADGVVGSVAAQGDDKILVGGNFNSVNGTARQGLARLQPDGLVDTNFAQTAVYPFIGGYVSSIAIQDDGRILAAGRLRTNNGAWHNIVRLHSDGAFDPLYGQGRVNLQSDDELRTIALQSNGKTILAGGFYSVNGLGFPRLARLNTDGSLDTNYNAGRKGPDSAWISKLVVQNDNKVIINGGSLPPHGVSGAGLLRLNEDGSVDRTFTATNVDRVGAIELLEDGKMLASGTFSIFVNGTVQYNIARLFANGQLDTNFASGLSFGHGLTATARQTDGKIVCVTDSGMLRLLTNGAIDATFTSMYGVDCLAVQPDNKIIVGGTFEVGTNRYITRLLSNGALDTSFGQGQSGANSYVSCVALQPDGKVLMGGYFTSVNGVPRYYVARLNDNGSLDSGFGTTNSGPNDLVLALSVQSSGKILIGGRFTSSHGAEHYRMARLNSDGSLDMSFSGPGRINQFGPYSDVLSISSDTKGRIFIGGTFNAIGNSGIRQVARLFGDNPPITISRSTPGQVQIAWPSGWIGFIPEVRADLNTGWNNVPEPISDDGSMRTVMIPTTNPASFYRLKN